MFSTTAWDWATTPTFQPAAHQPGNDVGADVGLAGARRSLDGEVGTIQVLQRTGDGRDVVGIARSIVFHRRECLAAQSAAGAPGAGCPARDAWAGRESSADELGEFGQGRFNARGGDGPVGGQRHRKLEVRRDLVLRFLRDGDDGLAGLIGMVLDRLHQQCRRFRPGRRASLAIPACGVPSTAWSPMPGAGGRGVRPPSTSPRPSGQGILEHAGTTWSRHGTPSPRS